jgi:hypothetical protein
MGYSKILIVSACQFCDTLSAQVLNKKRYLFVLMHSAMRPPDDIMVEEEKGQAA